MKKKNLIVFALCLNLSTFFGTPFAYSQKEIGIAAIVNNNVISNIDLQKRLQIAMFASGLPKNKDFEDKISRQILQGIIDEKIYTKIAEDEGLSISDEELKHAVGDIEKRNGIQSGKFREFAKSNGLDVDVMMGQIKGEMIWSKLVARKIRPKVNVTEQEINEKIEHIIKQANMDEVQISEIFLPFDKQADGIKVKEVADNLVKQLQKEKSFAKIAKQFSKASSSEKLRMTNSF